MQNQTQIKTPLYFIKKIANSIKLKWKQFKEGVSCATFLMKVWIVAVVLWIAGLFVVTFISGVYSFDNLLSNFTVPSIESVQKQQLESLLEYFNLRKDGKSLHTNYAELIDPAFIFIPEK